MRRSAAGIPCLYEAYCPSSSVATSQDATIPVETNPAETNPAC